MKLVNAIKSVAAVAVLSVSSLTWAADIDVNVNANDLAIQGYDAVAYFTESAPVKGDKAFTTDYNGAEWRFSSADNLAAFKAAPEKYAPQYGGYCAWAVSQNYTARGNPENFTVVDGKLYLNYNDEIQKRWEEDIPGFVAKADENWPGVLN